VVGSRGKWWTPKLKVGSGGNGVGGGKWWKLKPRGSASSKWWGQQMQVVGGSAVTPVHWLHHENKILK